MKRLYLGNIGWKNGFRITIHFIYFFSKKNVFCCFCLVRSLKFRRVLKMLEAKYYFLFVSYLSPYIIQKYISAALIMNFNVFDSEYS